MTRRGSAGAGRGPPAGSCPRLAARRLLALCGLVSVALAGCGSSPPLPASPAVVGVTMREYRFDLDHAVPRGRVIFRVRNVGRLGHQLILERLPKDLPGTLNEQLHSSTRRPVEALTILPGSRPGERTAFAADLAPGRYGLVCFVRDRDGRTHALKGMNAELRVR